MQGGKQMNYFSKANELYDVKNYKKAIKLYQKAIEIKEYEAESYYNAALCHIKLKDFEKAVLLLNKAVLLKQDSRYFFNLGYSYALLKNNKKALIYFNRAWALDNTDKDCEKAINLIMNDYKK